MQDSLIPIVDPPELAEDISFTSTCSYQLIRRLGEGGMGEVWLAERTSAGRHHQKVAIKFLFDAHAARSLAEEALRMSRLSHDNIIPFVDSGKDSGGRYFVAMAFVEGVDLDGLRTIIGLSTKLVYEQQSTVRVPDKIAAFILFMVLRALNHAHNYRFDDGTVGLIHRDVSPGNILLDEARGFVKLTDFGVAVRQSEEEAPTEIAGKVPYMAPEVLTGEAVDARADIYALGMVIYELLTGFNPNIDTSRLVSVVGAITNAMLAIERPLRPPHEVIEGIDPTFSRIVTQMLATDPKNRYPSAEAVTAELAHWMFRHGVGPTTASLASYMRLLRQPNSRITSRIRRSLAFLTSGDGSLNVCPPWKLTTAATEDVLAHRTPGRIWS